MSELQIVLIAIGALIILAVLMINWWQERRFHRQVEKSFSPLKRDVLLENQAFDDLNFDTNNLNDVEYDRFDNRATDHFTIDEMLAEPPSKSPATKFHESDRFVKLPQDNDAELAKQENESIEAKYNELINSKLDKLPASTIEDDSSNLKNVNPEQSNDFKVVFDDALSHQDNKSSNTNKGFGGVDVTDTTVSLPALLDSHIDLIALLYLAVEAPVSRISNALTLLFDNFDKPVFVHVLDSNKEWHLLKDLLLNQEALNRQISRVSCSMQMADRGGAVARSTLNRFQLAVETLGLDINGHVEWQDAGDALTSANALDLFCIEVDKTIGFHLVHGENGAFTGTKLRGLAEAQGLILNSDGGFKYFDPLSEVQSTSKQALIKPQIHPSFVMFNRDDHPFSPEMLRSSVVKGVTFQLDIPHVKKCAEVFTHMVQVGRQMEIGLNAMLVDDNNKALGDIQVEKIRQQLKIIQANMLVRGIVPGSDSAHRLFS